MIIETILNLLSSVITTVFGILPSIPSLPTSIDNSINTVFDTIFSNIQLIGCFVRVETLAILIPIIIVLMNFDNIYKITMFILKKIPMLGIND